jgi:hypothetical protein
MRSSTKLLAGLAALALMCSASRVSAACTNGDVTGGGVGIADVGAILACNGTRAIPPANPNPSVCDAMCSGAGILDCGDLNVDGQITTADAVLLLNEWNAPGKNVMPLCVSQGPTVPCGSVIDAAAGNITSNEVLSGCEYSVKGTVFVEPGVVLTVRPGAVVKGVAGAPTVSTLVFMRADDGAGNPCPASPPANRFTARINGAGTPTQPIVFTSDQPVGSRHSGDWGGLVFTGCSRVNDSGGVSNSEGIVGLVFGGGTDCVSNGGTANCNDSSGLLRYARIEFGGNEISPDNELNVLTQNGLGSNTKFTYLQAHMGLDDGFEWFGGTNSAKYLVATGNRDDNFDWQLGTDVKVQYGIEAQYKPNNDALNDNALEGDNNERGLSNLAPSQPQFCNMTLVGFKGQPYPDIIGGTWYGALFRRGTAAQIAKTIFTNWNDGGFTMRDVETAGHACTGAGPFTLVDTDPSHKTCAFGTNAGTNCTTDANCGGTTNSCAARQNLLIRNSLFYNNGSTGTIHAVNHSSTGSKCNSSQWFGLLQADPALNVKANAVYPDATLNPGIQAGPFWPPISFVPTNATAVADDPLSGGFDCGVGFSSFFDSTDYMGAIDPAGTDWTQTPGGWISYATQ